MDPQPIPVLTEPPSQRISRGVVVVSRGERLLDDLAFAAEIGLTHVRLDAPWAQAQPKAATLDGGVIEELVVALTAARRLGLEPWLRLLPPDVPHWFLDEGGFTDPATAARWWPRWVETVAGHVGDIVGGWVPLAAPFGSQPASTTYRHSTRKCRLICGSDQSLSCSIQTGELNFQFNQDRIGSKDWSATRLGVRRWALPAQAELWLGLLQTQPDLGWG